MIRAFNNTFNITTMAFLQNEKKQARQGRAGRRPGYAIAKKWATVFLSGLLPLCTYTRMFRFIIRLFAMPSHACAHFSSRPHQYSSVNRPRPRLFGSFLPPVRICTAWHHCCS
jgi:hypothetical protein